MNTNRNPLLELKQKDLVDYLYSLGHKPTKIIGRNYWYLSPLRVEKTASFKINRALNAWYDFGIGKGGDIIEFGKLYHHCTVSQFLHMFDRHSIVPRKARFKRTIEQLPPDSPSEKVSIKDCQHIADPGLIDYLHFRNIPLIIANEFCLEVEFVLYGKTQLALGFENELGGFELRSPCFKGSNSPKAITIFKNNPLEISVFEGFFDFLSFQAEYCQNMQCSNTAEKTENSYIILNSLAFFEKSKCKMEQYEKVNLYLDRDESGLQATKLATDLSKIYIDRSFLYAGYKDLNDYHRQKDPGKLLLSC